MEREKELLKWGIEHSDPAVLKASDFDPKSLVHAARRAAVLTPP